MIKYKQLLKIKEKCEQYLNRKEKQHYDERNDGV